MKKVTNINEAIKEIIKDKIEVFCQKNLIDDGSNSKNYLLEQVPIINKEIISLLVKIKGTDFQVLQDVLFEELIESSISFLYVQKRAETLIWANLNFKN